jgi:polyketide synthase 5
VSAHPLLGPQVRLQEEPERHVWQAEVGLAAQPWLTDHRIRTVAVLPGAAYCEMALAAARTALGEAAEVRDIVFKQALLLDEQTTLGASTSLASPGAADFLVESQQGGGSAELATAILRVTGSTAGHMP